eukprot:TRINITY_DN1344_c0_g1_i1.p1 TRINITY_DN1344_c0_g1~~TRINITY_DN1344_c0_g1_i1.p1  ORF type:complete len:560 (-),score=127.10 TRINITY_DN1344_c0_g1_i1:62-1741(-)
MVDIEEADMFCYQCEQTQDGKGCTLIKGVCGKTSPVAALQDMLIEVLKKISTYASLCRSVGIADKALDRWILEAIFSTLTNVNFDEKRFDEYLRLAAFHLKTARDRYLAECEKKKIVPKAVKNGDWEYKPFLTTLIEEGRLHVLPKQDEDWDIASTKNLTLFGIKGAAAYLHHAVVLGFEDEKISEDFQMIISKLITKMTFEEAIGLALKTGDLCYRVMELLDRANTQSYGTPIPTQVRMSPVKGKCILVSGHDLRDLDILLKQTKDKGVNVYTHGEMLPCNAYPKLKEYKHLVGHYGGPWQLQKTDFDKFPGAIMMTTNCIIEPKKSYADRIFTRAAVGWPGVRHIEKDDMGPVIETALKQPGFKDDAPKKEITIGFSHKSVIGMADTIVNAVKKGAIKHFFVIGGCDGTETERNYFTDFAKAIPKDCVILTCGCGKFRINYLDLGIIDFEGAKIPRLLDAGQCNDAFGAVQIAIALSKAFNCGVNDLPLSLVISWFEQKAVAVFLALLHLGMKNMILGPRLPAFVTPKLLKILVEKFNVKPIGVVQDDLKFLSLIHI